MNEKYKQNNDKNTDCIKQCSIAASGNDFYEQNAIAYLGQLPDINFDQGMSGVLVCHMQYHMYDITDMIL